MYADEFPLAALYLGCAIGKLRADLVIVAAQNKKRTVCSPLPSR